MDTVNPLIRWAGSKRQLLGVLGKHWKPKIHRRYVEPFAGSASLFFHLGAPEGILSDINAELINAYISIRDSPSTIYAELSSLPISESFYYELRAVDPDSMPENQRAARFIYLNRYCFNGLYRTNLNGVFNVPYGGGKSGSLPTLAALRHYASLLERVDLRICDYKETLARCRSGDFVYMDPPYATTARRVFNEYGISSFTASEVPHLKGQLDSLSNRGIEFLVSYEDTPEARQLASSYDFTSVVTKRHISGFASSRRQASEVLISNRKLIHGESN